MESDKRHYFTSDEKVYLTELVALRRDVLESKKTDCISISHRKKAWIELANEFNAAPENSKRTCDQLRKCWDNIKTKRKKELVQDKRCRLLTGGGSYKPTTEEGTPFVDDVLDCVKTELDDAVDSDTIALSQASTHVGEYVFFDDVLHVAEPAVATNNDEGMQSPIFVPMSPVAKTPKTTGYSSRGTAIDRELEVRLKRNVALEGQEKELHEYRMKEQQLKIEALEYQAKVGAEQEEQERQLHAIRVRREEFLEKQEMELWKIRLQREAVRLQEAEVKLKLAKAQLEAEIK